MIDAFIKHLQTQPCTERANNFYLDYPQAVSNLTAYLHYLNDHKPDYMLVGEAPGYRGCAITGVPFTSERLIRTEIIPTGIGLTAEGDTWENTATIVWSEIDPERVPLMWNAFPFHPHQPGQRTTNRKPTRTEIDRANELLMQLIQWFDPATIIAVGQAAQSALTWKSGVSRIKGRKIHKVRHPSYGGKQDYINGVRRILASA